MACPVLTFDPTTGYTIDGESCSRRDLDYFARIHSLTPLREHLAFIGAMPVREFLRMRATEAKPLAPFRFNIMGGESHDVLA